MKTGIENSESLGKLLLNAGFEMMELEAKNAALKESLTEIIPLAQRAKSGLWANDPYVNQANEIIERARKLIE